MIFTVFKSSSFPIFIEEEEFIFEFSTEEEEDERIRGGEEGVEVEGDGFMESNDSTSGTFPRCPLRFGKFSSGSQKTETVFEYSEEDRELDKSEPKLHLSFCFEISSGEIFVHLTEKKKSKVI